MIPAHWTGWRLILAWVATIVGSYLVLVGVAWMGFIALRALWRVLG